MTDCLIFSKDRPMQLDLLLQSIDRYAAHTFATVTVLTPALSSSRRCAGRPGVEWWSEHPDFQTAVRAWLTVAPHACFLVDDGFFFRDAPASVTPSATLRPGDYDYFFTLDGGIYDHADVLNWTEGRHFDNPTQLEAGVASLVDGRSFPVEAQFPCFVGVPHNRVSVSSGVPTMGGSAAELEARYLAGERIDLDAMVAQVYAAPRLAPHMNLSYVYRPA